MKKVVKAIIIKEEKFLLQLRDNKTTISYPNHWSFFGGEVDENETEEQALIRELVEEISWKPNNFSYYSTFIDLSTKAIVKLFLINFEMTHSNLSLNEGQRMKWFGIDEIQDLIKTPSNMFELLNKINIKKRYEKKK